MNSLSEANGIFGAESPANGSGRPQETGSQPPPRPGSPMITPCSQHSDEGRHCFGIYASVTQHNRPVFLLEIKPHAAKATVDL